MNSLTLYLLCTTVVYGIFSITMSRIISPAENLWWHMVQQAIFFAACALEVAIVFWLFWLFS